jgi:primosomal protein N'
MGDQATLRAERIAAKKRENDLKATIEYLKSNLETAKLKNKKESEENKLLMERYQHETSNKIRLLEESIRLQDESTTIAKEARNQIREDIQSKFDKQLRALLTVREGGLNTHIYLSLTHTYIYILLCPSCI